MIGKIAAAMLALLLATAQSAIAQDPQWPTRPVKIVLPYPAGSGTDALLRSLAVKLSSNWGQPVIVENRPGANTIMGVQAVTIAPPDGHTLLFTSDASITTNPFLYKKLPYDAQKDLTPVALIATTSMVLVVRKDFPAKSLGDLLIYARANPGAVSYASIGIGSQLHLLTEFLGTRAEVKFLHVPYKGIPEAMVALVKGEVDFSWGSPYALNPFLRDGRIKAIAIANSSRNSGMPDVPTLSELRFPEVNMPVWFGLFAPGATPKSVVDRINGDVQKVILEPKFAQDEIRSKGYQEVSLTPEGFAERIKRELPASQTLIRASGARLD